jgi:hypothetical protein
LNQFLGFYGEFVKAHHCSPLIGLKFASKNINIFFLLSNCAGYWLLGIGYWILDTGDRRVQVLDIPAWLQYIFPLWLLNQFSKNKLRRGT